MTLFQEDSHVKPFSVAGRRKGKDDDRYLWEEMLRVITTIKPTYVVGENVTGIIGMALDTVLSDWKHKTTPQKRILFQLAVKMHGIGEIGSGLLLTPTGQTEDEQKENGQIHVRNRIDKTEKQVRGTAAMQDWQIKFYFTNTDTFGELQSSKEFKTEQYNTNGGEGELSQTTGS